MKEETITYILSRVEEIDMHLKNIYTNENTDFEVYDEAVQIGYELGEIKDAIKKETPRI